VTVYSAVLCTVRVAGSKWSNFVWATAVSVPPAAVNRPAPPVIVMTNLRFAQQTRRAVEVGTFSGQQAKACGVAEVGLHDGTITVRDHGPSIDAEDLPRVFDRFYRAPAARAMSGSGLGLAIVRRVVDGHGGSVTLGAAPGGGTIACIRLSTAGVDYGPIDAVEEPRHGVGSRPSVLSCSESQRHTTLAPAGDRCVPSGARAATPRTVAAYWPCGHKKAWRSTSDTRVG
jgi:hypothetical protein